MRGGVIEAVGPRVDRVPADARVIDVSGKVVHAAFIDPYVSVGPARGQARRSGRPTTRAVRAEAGAGSAARATGPAAHPVDGGARRGRARSTGSTVKDDVAETYRRQGFAVVAAVPTAGVLRGRGAVVSLADGPGPGRVLDRLGRPASSRMERSRTGDEYPTSNMGAVAVARQAFLDALWWRDAEAAYAAQPGGPSRGRGLAAATAALVPAAEGRETVVFEATDVLSLLRAARDRAAR